MFIEPLLRQMAICSLEGAGRLTSLDKAYWNVVSIHGPREQKAHLQYAKKVHFSCFDDVEEERSETHRSPRREDVRSIFEFLDRLPNGSPKEPVMIHCQQGISRSAALALSWIYRELSSSRDRDCEAVDIVLSLRPTAKPNRLVLRFGLEQFLSASEAKERAEKILEDPRLESNRFLPSDVSNDE